MYFGMEVHEERKRVRSKQRERVSGQQQREREEREGVERGGRPTSAHPPRTPIFPAWPLYPALADPRGGTNARACRNNTFSILPPCRSLPVPAPSDRLNAF